MGAKRVDRLNSLLKEVISDVIFKEVKTPHLPKLVSVTRVDITPDLRYAKVYVSVIGEEEVGKKAIKALQDAAGFIAVRASKKVVMRYFPELRFILDDSLDKQMSVESLIMEIQKERESREPSCEEDYPSSNSH